MERTAAPPVWARASAVALVAAYAVLLLAALSGSRGDTAGTWVVLPAVVCAVVLLVRAWDRPVAVAVTLMAGALVVEMVDDLLGRSGLLHRVAESVWALTIPMNAVILTVVPDPPTSRWGRWLLRLEVLGIAVAVLVTFVVSGGESPVFVLAAAGVGIAILCIPVAVVRLLVLARRARGPLRSQLGLLLAGGVLVVAVYLVITAAVSAVAGDDLAQAITGALLVTAMPVAVTVATVGYGMYGVRLAVNRLLRAAIIVGAATLAALVAAAALGSLLGRDATSPAVLVGAVLAALAVAVPLLPAARRAADAVAPVEDAGRRALRSIAVRLDALTPATDLPEAVVAELGDALDATGVTLWESSASGRTVLASWGEGAEGTGATPLRYGGRDVGSLAVAPAPDAATRAVLTDLAPHVASALEAGRLTRELERSRQRLEVVRDDERARLRRDLHDELSPSLSGMRLAVAAARRRLGGEDEELDRTLQRLGDETTSSMDVVRRILDDLRPQALDSLGLAGALQARADALSSSDVRVQVDCAAGPALPPAVELAAYRIATEAMSNALRHSGGSRCEVRVETAGEVLVVTVADDGTGWSGSAPGVGTDSMRERASSVGGHVAMGAAPGGGTLVEARLPCGDQG